MIQYACTMDFMTPRVLYEQNKIPYLCVDNTIHNV